MISPFVKFYVRVETWKKKRQITDVDKILNQEINQFNSWIGKVRYAWFWSAGVHVPNASATIPGVILINAEWASKIILDQDNPDMHDAFKLTIFHEITHQENDFSMFEFFTTDSKFVNWVNEVHADYGGTEKAFDGVVDKAILGMKYKLSCKKKQDKDTRSHPSWEKRINYILKYDFNSNLIEQIAIDAGCKNERLIHAVKDHFRDITLRR